MIYGNGFQNLQWTPLIWFKGCIKKHSICAWMFLQGKLKTEDFLLQRNVDCDSCFVLCDCTWESGSHLMPQCSYFQSVWTPLLAKLNLTFLLCNSPIKLMESSTLRIDQRHKGILTVGKLVCCAFIWHSWNERNRRIFQATSKPALGVLVCYIVSLR